MPTPTTPRRMKQRFHIAFVVEIPAFTYEDAKETADDMAMIGFEGCGLEVHAVTQIGEKGEEYMAPRYELDEKTGERILRLHPQAQAFELSMKKPKSPRKPRQSKD